MKPGETRDLITNSEDLETTYLGTCESRLGVEENVGLSDDKRMTHVLNVGPTGYGKSTLMLHTALQDAYKDYGLCIINPKGRTLSDDFLTKLPEDRREDVVYINPDRESVTPINVLEPHVTPEMSQAQVENQKEIIVSDLIDLFKRYSDNWGDRFGRV
ncbi:MAG: type IV secretory system conjugative DNA transfer family protein, partial [Candidatus Nanohaloarchaea archaeon]|nr:type IV secretory system conjugative DNA transfer family protein [Candidatus Nanohaloarchaea archaeon]